MFCLFGEGAALGAKTSAIAYTCNEALHEGIKQAQEALKSQEEPKPSKDINTKNEKNVGWAEKSINWFNQKLKIDTTNKYFDPLYASTKYINSLIQGCKGIIVGLIVTAYGPPPFDFIAGGLTATATTQMAVDAYRSGWMDITPYDGIPVIENPR